MMRIVMMMAALIGSTGAAAAPLIGQWGGDSTIVQLSESGGRIEQDCASGEFTGAARPDAKGHFSVPGHFTDHQPGPQAEDARGTPARFVGHVAGTTLHLAIHIGDAPPRRFTLVSGQGVKLLRCY
ncbi:hypothetical protein [Sandarakinorhabdus sp.]|jgi:hypothetical protein|uniref:hypothetical protein n=1 Tax=Sandarakinorhabdus sp. TaxID=1916663 RepID=UPI0028A82910|nr:hypothetical protein [Sandarakinorhabdus sp.]